MICTAVLCSFLFSSVIILKFLYSRFLKKNCDFKCKLRLENIHNSHTIYKNNIIVALLPRIIVFVHICQGSKSHAMDFCLKSVLFKQQNSGELDMSLTCLLPIRFESGQDSLVNSMYACFYITKIQRKSLFIIILGVTA